MTKVDATEDEKIYWNQKLREGTEAREKLQELEVAKARKVELLQKSLEELRNLEQNLQVKYLAWGLGKPRKTLFHHKEKIRKARDLADDCQQAVKIIEVKILACWPKINRGMTIRDRIQKRLEEAKKAD